MVKKKLLLILGLLTIPGIVFAAIHLPQTGQTKCYRGVNPYDEITCAGTGQDGDLQEGVSWPYPRFEAVPPPPAVSSAVIDNLTGLMWFKSGGAPDIPPLPAAPICNGDTQPWPWQNALNYVACVNGFYSTTAWRLPNILELKSLMDSSQGELTDWLNGRGFYLNTQEGPGGTVNWYWSSTTLGSNTAQAWSFNPIHQGDSAIPKTDTSYHFTLPVQTGTPIYDNTIPAEVPKTGQSTCYDTAGVGVGCTGTGQDGELQQGADWAAVTRWTDNGTTITDNLTGLVWPKEANTPTWTTCTGGNMTWQEALDYVACLNSNSYLGHSDWRLPNRVELTSVINYDWIDEGSWPVYAGFSNVQNTPYWSSTTYMCEKISQDNNYICPNTPTSYAWAITFTQGALSHLPKNTNRYVWPVRDGDLFGGPAVSVPPADYTFPDTYVGYTPPLHTFTITNTGTNNLYINLITNSDQEQFPKANDTCSYHIIPPAGSCSFEVYFYPSSGGPKNATLSIPSNISIPDVHVSGNALEFEVTTAPDANGNISCTPQDVPHQQTYLCTITPTTQGYVVANVTVGKTGNAPRSLGPVTSYELANILSPMTITATFVSAPVKRMTGPTYHSSFSEALSVASPTGDVIKGKAASFVENLVVNKAVTLKGGYVDDTFSNASGKTTINGLLTVGTGSLIVENIEFASDPWASVTSAIEAVQSQFPGDLTGIPPYPSGLTVEVMTPAGVVYSRPFGNFRNDTYAPVASGSKMVTATVLLRLVDLGELTLDTKTKDVPILDTNTGLPWSGNMGKIRLRDLLSFTSGIASNVPAADTATSLTDAVQAIYNDQSATAAIPGAQFNYDLGTHLRIAARMAVIKTGQSWQLLFQEYLRTPLGWDNPTSNYGGGDNPDPAGSLACTGLEYTSFLMLQLRAGLGLSTGFPVSVSKGLIDQQRLDAFGPSTVIVDSPYMDELGLGYHYGFGNWIETEDGQANSPVTRLSSTGKFGWAPWIAADGTYAAIIMTKQPDLPGSIVPSESLKTQLDPLIRAALAQNPPVIRPVP